MRPINRKLVRELQRLRGQLISIALVVATGVVTVVTMRGTYDSLVSAQDEYYRDTRFPDVWASLKRAPESLRQRIEQIPGIGAVETRVTFLATLDVPGLDEPALGRFVSVPVGRPSTVGDIHLTGGRYVEAGSADEVMLSKNFATETGLVPGTRLGAIINGRLRTLDVVGAAIAPEHMYPVPPGALYPDNQRYGVLWMSRHDLGPAFDMDGAFNEVVVTLAPGANTDVVIAQLDELLEPYGGLGAYTRKDQLSHSIMQSEIDQNRTMGTAVPAIFLAVAAFLLNIVLSRLIGTQRTEIGVLKAFGYTNREVGWHYLGFGLVAVTAGAILGTGLGIWAGQAMVGLYSDYFEFPDLRYRLNWLTVAVGAGVSLVAAILGALVAVQRAVRLPPAEAMRPEPPARFKAGPLERLGLNSLVSPATRMIVRNVERQPVRSLFSAIGVAFSVAILVIGMFMFDGVDYMMELQFQVAEREDLSLSFLEPLPETVRYDLIHLPGVTHAEPFRSLPVRLRNGHREREVGIMGMTPDSHMRRIVAASGAIHPLPPEGVVLSSILAKKLDVGIGDTMSIEVLEGERRTGQIVVVGVVEDFVGLSAYMDIDAVHSLAGGGRVASGAYLNVEPQVRQTLNARLKRLPSVAGVTSPSTTLASFEKQLGDSLFIAIGFMLAFAGVISVAVIYNGARIALSERGRELASLRVLGFTRREVATLLFGEQAAITVFAIPLGWVIGYILSFALSASLQSDAYRVPMIISARTYLWSAVAVIVAATFSSWMVRQRLDRLDLIAVLKTRE